MSARAMRWASAQLKANAVSGGLPARALLLLLADEDRPDQQIFLSVRTLAGRLDCSERTVQRALASLEDDGLVERDERWGSGGRSRQGDPGARQTTSRYVLLLDGEARQVGDVQGDIEAPGGVTECRGEGDTQSPLTSFEPSNLSDASSDELAVSEVRARDRERRAADARNEAAYRMLEAEWLRVAPGRVAERRARLAFAAIVADPKVDPALIVKAGLRFLAQSPDAKAGKVVMLDRFLAEGRWRGWEPKETPPPRGNVAPAAAPFGSWRDADAAFVEAVLHAKAPEWVDSYLVHCGWDGDERAIVAPLGITADQIGRELGRLLGQHEITVVVRKPAITERAA